MAAPSDSPQAKVTTIRRPSAVVIRPTARASRRLAPAVGSGAASGPTFPWYAPEPITVRVGDEEMTVDLKACASQAEAFAMVRRERLRHEAGGRPGDLVFWMSTPTTTHDDEERAEERTAQPDQSVDLCFPDFPGGIAALRQVVRYLEATAAEERAAAAAAGQLGVPAGVLKVDPSAFHVQYTVDNIGAYLEAAALLRCPRLLRDTVLAPAAKELSSRRVLSLLERVVLLTVEDFDMGGLCEEQGGRPHGDRSGDDALHGGSEASRTQVRQAFCQVVQRLCARLDAVDFRLTSALAAGAPWASLEVLRAFRVKVETVGRMNYALQAMRTTVTSYFYTEEREGQPHKQQQEWNEHHFSLHVVRRHIIESSLYSKDASLRKIAEQALADRDDTKRDWSDDDVAGPSGGGAKEVPEHTERDIPEAICDRLPDAVLGGLAGFAVLCDPDLTPPVLAAAMVRALLVGERVEEARALFEAIFVRSRKVQAMVVSGRIPMNFLCAVKSHRAASTVLRRLLARYESLELPELCHLLEHVLLEEFRTEQHCWDVVMHHALIQDIVAYCRVRTRAAAQRVLAPLALAEFPDGAATEASAAAAAAVEAADAALLQLRRIGERLFAVAFVLHGGFLPRAEDPDADVGAALAAGPLGGAAECPWDSGDLDLQLMQHAPDGEEAMHLTRKVLLRGLVRRQRAGVESDVRTTLRLWALGRWRSCTDEALIGEAFAFATSCWRAHVVAVRAPEGSDDAAQRAADEEGLFSVFSDLEFWRLPQAALMTAWVPPQLLACKLSARCKVLDEQQQAMTETNRSNLRAINRLRGQLGQLIAKLEVVDARAAQSAQRQGEVASALRTLR